MDLFLLKLRFEGRRSLYMSRMNQSEVRGWVLFSITIRHVNYVWITLWLIAKRMSCVVFCNCNFRIKLSWWTPTVLGLIVSVSAICAQECPSAINLNIWNSRLVSISKEFSQVSLRVAFIASAEANSDSIYIFPKFTWRTLLLF